MGELRCYPWFDIAIALVLSDVPDSFAGGDTATGRISYTREVKADGAHVSDILVHQALGWELV
jgi:hypothetical protein